MDVDPIEDLQNCQQGDGLAAQRHELDPPLDYTRTEDPSASEEIPHAGLSSAA